MSVDNEILNKETYFAPAGRDDKNTVLNQNQLVTENNILKKYMDSLPVMAMFLNEKRQVIAANESVCELFNNKARLLLGKRPGEIMDCIYSRLGPDGCGTAQQCTKCEAVEALLNAKKYQKKQTAECSVCLDNNKTLQLRITSAPVEFKSHTFYSVVIQDIGDTVRKRVLERSFFHDIINTAGGVSGFADLLAAENASPGYEQELKTMAQLAEQLINDIEYHRDLMYAENGALKIKPIQFQTQDYLQEIFSLYCKHQQAENKCIKLGTVKNQTIKTDKTILTRVIGNMVKNALEASEPGQTVTIYSETDSENIFFNVHNQCFIPEDIQAQIFKKTFSTKEQFGRGIGTHSMKLFGEKYLGAKVYFKSTEKEGTVFTIELPLK